MYRMLFLVLTAALLAAPAPGQAPAARSLQERLGYPAGAKLLIVHADDLGMAHTVNAASVKGLESGLVTSASVMVPCPWFPEIAAYAKAHPEADLGLHLTLTSEWKHFRWGGVLTRDRAKSLYAPDGYLYPSEAEAAAKIDVKEAEAEIRAQIERSIQFGMKPTHLDSHMGTLYQTKALFEMLLRVGREHRLPVMVARDWTVQAPFLPSILTPDDVVIERMVDVLPDVPPERWAAFYTDAVKNLKPGVTVLIAHLAYDDEEMRAISADHPDWGAAWRQRDFDYFTGEEFRKALRDNDVKLITWREVGKLLAAR
jgi:chitin disaccharide deacetylase